MRKRDEGSQFTLNLTEGVKSEPKRPAGNRVVPFVDASTLELRQTAIRRVASSGIFSLPTGLRKS